MNAIFHNLRMRDQLFNIFRLTVVEDIGTRALAHIMTMLATDWTVGDFIKRTFLWFILMISAIAKKDMSASITHILGSSVSTLQGSKGLILRFPLVSLSRCLVERCLQLTYTFFSI